MPLRAVFSDVDGTLVHYVKKLATLGYTHLGEAEPRQVHERSGQPIHVFLHEPSGQRVDCVPVFSATLGGGFCSLRTHELVAELRAKGVAFTVITGARTSTFSRRQQEGSLPICDFYVGEGGGRMWDVHGNHDDTWTDRFSKGIGPWRQQEGDMDSAAKVGPLWDAYRALAVPDVLGSGTGLPTLDGRSFVSSFLVDIRDGERSADTVLGLASASEKEAALRRLTANVLRPEMGVDVTVNLGKAQIAPVGVSKATATMYIASERLGVPLAASPEDAAAPESKDRPTVAALFDDDNDLCFARLCHLGYAPTIAHPNVVPALADLGPSFCRVPVEGLLGTEYALSKLVEAA